MASGASPLSLPRGLRERIGQMLLVGFRGLTAAEADPSARHIRAGHVGGVVLFDLDGETGEPRNVQSPAQVATLTAALKAMSPLPLLVTMDEEGGFFHRFKERYGFPRMASARELGERNDLAVTREAARLIASTLRDAGVDLNLAPVVDLTYPWNMTIAARGRSFSADPAVVTAHAREFVLAHHEVGVGCAIKHFAGSGGTVMDPISRIEAASEWSRAEIEPFRALAAEGLADAIMTTRVLTPQLDPEYQPMVSRKIVRGILRTEIGYDGVVISDAMENVSIWDTYGFERATILAVNAGVDILLYANQSLSVPYDDDRAERAIDVIEGAVERGEIAESRIDEAAGRVLRLKERLLERQECVAAEARAAVEA